MFGGGGGIVSQSSRVLCVTEQQGRLQWQVAARWAAVGHRSCDGRDHGPRSQWLTLKQAHEHGARLHKTTCPALAWWDCHPDLGPCTLSVLAFHDIICSFMLLRTFRSFHPIAP